jgi:NAD(P)-dependent dehydrogenase (short-subunit alcohol dehydrogenase family)
MTKTFRDQHVVITGGDGGLGHAVVRTFAAAGAICHLPVRGEATAPPADGVQVTGGIDLTDEPAVERYYGSLPPLAASVHLAGGFAAQPIAETTRADLERLLSINLVTAFLCSREAVKSMRRRGGGRIVNVAARVVEAPAAGMIAYTVSKAAVASLTRSLAEEVKAEGILVNAVLPSIIDTPANRAAMPKADHARWPQPTELAQAVLWLASSENVLTSGALVPVYGRA